MFLGWYDPDKHKSAREKITEAIERYREKFGGDPTTVILNIGELDDVVMDDALVEGFEYQGKPFIPQFTYYVGIEEETSKDLVSILLDQTRNERPMLTGEPLFRRQKSPKNQGKTKPIQPEGMDVSGKSLVLGQLSASEREGNE